MQERELIVHGSIYATTNRNCPAAVSHDPQIRKLVILSSGTVPHLQQLAVAEFRPGQTTTMHSHKDVYEIFVVINGAGKFISNTSSINLECGDWLLVPPQCDHSFSSSDDKSLAMLYFGVA